MLNSNNGSRSSLAGSTEFVRWAGIRVSSDFFGRTGRGGCGLAELTNPSFNAEQLLCQWQQNQAEWLDQEAETIRNGLLQDLFAVRRKLELLDGQATDCLVDFEHLYHSLKHLADRLSSPYIHDSFPLAIQHTVSIWDKTLPLKLYLPVHWPEEPVVVTSLVLSILDKVLHSLEATPPAPQHCLIYLAEATEGKQLILQANHCNAIPPLLTELCQSDEWLFRLHTFQIVTGGKTICLAGDSSLKVQLTW